MMRWVSSPQVGPLTNPSDGISKYSDAGLYLDTRNSIDDAQNLFYSTQMPTTSKTTELSSLKV